jgi:hypothetical protein
VARLIPNVGSVDQGTAARAAANIVARRKGVTLGGLKIKDLVEEGRR